MIYVASSWRNPVQPQVVANLREAGFACYDFRHPRPDNTGFRWSEVATPGIDWKQWSREDFRAALSHPIAEQGFAYDLEALRSCSTLLMVMPCGRSAHLELGYACGMGKPAIIYLPEGYDFEPELMYKAAEAICLTMAEVLQALRIYEPAGETERTAGDSLVEYCHANRRRKRWGNSPHGAMPSFVRPAP